MIDHDATTAAIASAMTRKKCTQTTLAKNANVDQSQISRICAGRFKRRSKNLERVCRVLGVSITQKQETEEGLIKLLRSIVRRRPGKIPAVGRALEALGELAD